MPDASYDAVIIGGGHNGLCTAAYLARAGLKVGVFERRHEEGGGANTEEATVPGFWHNLHAQYMEFIDYMPVYQDFDLPSFGARMIKPEAQVGIAFADGRPPLIIYTPDLEEKTHASIAGILTKNGRATGVRLRDGREIEARIIASNADPRTTFMELLGWDKLSLFRKERLANWRFGPEHVLGTPSFALHEAPDYKSAKHDADINRCFYTMVGFENANDVEQYILQAYGGRIPETPGAGTWVNSLWDPSQAPPGQHVMNGWFFFPKASCLSPQEWDEVRATYNGRFLNLWSKYAPNMTSENVIADKLYVPFDIEKKIGMPEGDFSHGRPGSFALGVPRAHVYRTEVEGLYMCGASAGGGGVSAAPGYNAFKVIADDHDLPRIWQREDRIY